MSAEEVVGALFYVIGLGEQVYGPAWREGLLEMLGAAIVDPLDEASASLAPVVPIG